MMKRRDSLVEDLLARGVDDWIQAAEIVDVVIRTGLNGLEHNDPVKLRTRALGLITEVVVAGLMVAGDVTERVGFEPWGVPPGDAVERIASEWLARSDPDVMLGEIVWLSNTPKGNAIGEAVLEREATAPKHQGNTWARATRARIFDGLLRRGAREARARPVESIDRGSPDPMMQRESMLEDLLAHGVDDWVDACEVFDIARGGLEDLSDRRALALGLITEVLVAGLMVPGDVTEHVGFGPWNVSAGAAVERIASEWLARSDPPVMMGDIVWLRNTPQGDAIGEAVLERAAAARGDER